MVIWVSLRYFFLSFLLALPVFTAHLQRGERIKRAYQRFFFSRFNLCDTSVRECLARIVRPTFGRQPERTDPRLENPPAIFFATISHRTRVPKNRTDYCGSRGGGRYERYRARQNNVRFLYFFAGNVFPITRRFPAVGKKVFCDKCFGDGYTKEFYSSHL